MASMLKNNVKYLNIFCLFLGFLLVLETHARIPPKNEEIITSDICVTNGIEFTNYFENWATCRELIKKQMPTSSVINHSLINSFNSN